MSGSRGSFDPFVGHARPHPGQIESAHLIWSLLSDSKFAQGDEVEVKIYPGVDHPGIILALSPAFRGKAPVLADMTGFLRSHTA